MSDEININEQMPPEGQIVFTVINDDKGRRNEALLKRQGRLFFFPDGGMYVYYRPTHWREATSDEMQQLRKAASAKVRDAQSIVDTIDEQIDHAEAA